MGTIDSMLVNMELDIHNYEYVKEAICQKLVELELLDVEAATEFANTYGIIVIKQSWYKRIFNGGEYIIKCVKLRNVEKDSKDRPDSKD